MLRKALAIIFGIVYLLALAGSLFVIIKPRAGILYRRMALNAQLLYPSAGAYEYHFLFDDDAYDPASVLIQEDDRILQLAYLGDFLPGGEGTYSLKVIGANHARILIVPTGGVDPAREAHDYSLLIRPYLLSRVWASIILSILLALGIAFLGFNLADENRRKILLGSPPGVLHAWFAMFQPPWWRVGGSPGSLRRDAPPLLMLVILALSTWMQVSFWQDDATDFDIYYLYRDGQRVLDGQNPYQRVLASDMLTNDKFTTVFPAMVELSYAVQKFIFPRFEPAGWLAFWRLFTLLANLGTIVLLFRAFDRAGKPVLAVFAALFWEFNRWTLAVEASSGPDFIPILFLLVSLLLLPRKPGWGLFFYSLSLAFKQIAIFLLPVYLIYMYQTAEKERIRRVLLSFLGIISVPLLTSLPFLVWNAKGFIYSIIFSATRSQFQFAQPADSLDMILKLTGLPARLPLLLLLLLIYTAAWKYRLHLYVTCMLVMAVFVDFNSLLFFQYVPWFILVLLLGVLSIIREPTPPLTSMPA